MINDRIYQYIFDEISLYLPKAWDRLVVYLEYGEASYSISFYIKATGRYIKCYDLENISEEDLYLLFKRINKEVSDILGDNVNEDKLAS